MLHLILGGAGSGKSTYVTDKIAENVRSGQKAWLLIPEQQANLSERTLLPSLPPHAGLIFTVTGFVRLSREVADHYGGAAFSVLDDRLRSLLMWENLRELSGLLEEYGQAKAGLDTDLTEKMLLASDDLHANGITPAKLEQAASAIPEGDALAPKLRDLALICAGYENSLAECFEDTAPDEIGRLAKMLENCPYFVGGHLYFDSFTSFTAEEYRVLAHLLRQADEVTVTLCCDKLHSLNPAFDSVCDTARRLIRLCEDAGITYEIVTLPKNQRSRFPELSLLERELWDFSLRAEDRTLPPAEERGHITLIRSTNLYAEAEALSLHILDSVHHGIPYGDMAVIVRDPEAYRGVIDAALERRGIPHYFSEKTTLAEKSLSRLILSSLRAISRGFPSQEVMTVLKTGLFPVDPADRDLFEQYVESWDLTGSAFTSPLWTRNPDGYTDKISPRGLEILNAANRVREAVMTPLLRLHSRLEDAGTLPAMCTAIYDYLQELDIPARCAALASEELSQGYLKEAGETVRVYDTVCETLILVSSHRPSLTLTTEELAAVLGMIFRKTEIASVPSLHDSVTIGSAATLRVENIRVAFLLGLNEGEFPLALNDNGLLCDADKKRLVSYGIEFDGNADTQSSDELLYLYRAMTKPSEHLFLSTVAADLDGRQKSPSLAFQRVRYLFPYLADNLLDFDLSLLGSDTAEISADVSSQDVATPVIPPNTPALTLETDENSGAHSLYCPIPPSPADLPEEDARRFLGDTLWLTQSRIQSFVQCPYRFYSTYLLSVREQKTYSRVRESDSGTFLHFVLEQFLRQCLTPSGDFTLPTPEMTETMTDTITADYINRILHLDLSEMRTLHVLSRLRALTLVILRDILTELSHSAFQPHDFELRIGGNEPDSPPPYEIPLDDGRKILLGGTVDRVDWYWRGEELFLRVVDYKSGSKEFSVDDVRRGLNLQLLIYLFSLCRQNRTRPAGVMYLAAKEDSGIPVPERTGILLNDPEILSAMNDACDPAYLAGITRKKDGTFSGRALADADSFATLEDDIRFTLSAIGNDMMKGRAAKTPSAESCRYCPLKNNCAEAIPDR